MGIIEESKNAGMNYNFKCKKLLEALTQNLKRDKAW